MCKKIKFYWDCSQAQKRLGACMGSRISKEKVSSLLVSDQPVELNHHQKENDWVELGPDTLQRGSHQSGFV